MAPISTAKVISVAKNSLARRPVRGSLMSYSSCRFLEYRGWLPGRQDTQMGISQSIQDCLPAASPTVLSLLPGQWASNLSQGRRQVCQQCFQKPRDHQWAGTFFRHLVVKNKWLPPARSCPPSVHGYRFVEHKKPGVFTGFLQDQHSIRNQYINVSLKCLGNVLSSCQPAGPE